MILNILLELLFLAIPLYYFRKHKLKPVIELGLERKKASQAWKHTLIILAAMFLAAITLSAFLSLINYNDIGKVSQALQEARQEPAYFVFAFTVGVILEEFFFRGFLVKRIGILSSSALFGTMHLLYGSIAEVAGAFALGLVLAYFWKKYKNLYANTYAHLLWNAMGLIASSFV